MSKKVGPYGFELIMDLHECDVTTFTRDSLQRFFETLCRSIEMERCELYFWDDVGVPSDERQTSPQTVGTSAVQFILTSTIVVHTLDLSKAVYVNVFSCKGFDRNKAEKLTREWFNAGACTTHFIERN